MMLLWSSRELRARQKMLAGQALEMSGMLILAMPGIVLATGFFLLLNNTIGLPQHRLCQHFRQLAIYPIDDHRQQRWQQQQQRQHY
ncbi:thiamine transporter membrane protein [Shigella flexneri]|nr:thiamine transporter membrane protein [Shigella flexneri]